jgi:hypothetical protein
VLLDGDWVAVLETANCEDTIVCACARRSSAATPYLTYYCVSAARPFVKRWCRSLLSTLQVGQDAVKFEGAMGAGDSMLFHSVGHQSLRDVSLSRSLSAGSPSGRRTAGAGAGRSPSPSRDGWA